MEQHLIVVLGFGVLVLLVAWLPHILSRLPLSLPILCVGIGALAFALPELRIDLAVLQDTDIYEQLTEAVLLIALMGAGLKIDRPLGWRRWNSAWRLIGIGMPIMMLLTAAIGLTVLGLSLAGAVFLAALLTPTDPVLASQVAVGPPGTGVGSETRFALTAEAGLNDGLAFPVVALALALASAERLDIRWFAGHFVWQITLAIGVGWAVGRLIGFLTFRIEHLSLSNAAGGLVAIGSATISFAITEIIGGYGLIAVFLSALSLRGTSPEDPFHRAMAEFAEQVERVLVMIVLVAFGGALTNGLLDGLGWREITVALTLLFVARPVSVVLAMPGSPAPWAARGAIAFFGIRGIGTLYYLVYVAGKGGVPGFDRIAALVSFAVLASIIVHGLAASPVMAALDRRRERSLERGHHQNLVEMAGKGYRIEQDR